MKRKIIESILFFSVYVLMMGISSKVYADESSVSQAEKAATETVTTNNETTKTSEVTSDLDNVAPQTTDDTVETTDTEINITAKWVKNEKGYRYQYSDGKYAKHGIITVNKAKYYIGKDGYRKNGVITYQGNKYYFSKKSGKMYNGTKLITYKKSKYYVVKGKVAIGLKKIKKTYYYFSKKNGRMIKNKLKNVKGTYYQFGKSGKGIKKTAAQAYAIKLIKKLCKSKDSRQEKLRKGFLYMVHKYHYAVKAGYVSPNSSDWVDKFAYNIYTTHSGRCYSFAAAFGVYAKEVGYKAKVIKASTHGRNGGYVPHAWVEVVQGGRTYVYDPELAYASKNVSAYYKKTYASTGGRYRK